MPYVWPAECVSQLIARFAWLGLIDGRLEALAAESINLEWGPNEAPSAVAMSVILLLLLLFCFPYMNFHFYRY